MNTKSPQDIGVEWFERVWNQRSKDAIRELLAEDSTVHQEGGAVVRGPSEFFNFHDLVLTAFPDLKIRVLQSLGNAEKAAIHWEASGTHRGEFFGIAATQQPLVFSGMSFLISQNGQITEGWDCWNVGGLMAKLSAGAH